MAEEKRRIQWIDALKGYGIFLVTLGHLNPWLPLETHIYSFHMCLFFFLSGYLFKCKVPLNRYVLKKTKTIFVPFIIWDLLATLVTLLSGGNVQDAIRQLLVYQGNLCWDATIWFLLVLFMVECIYAIIMHICDSDKISVIILIVCVLLWIGWYKLSGVSFSLELNLIPLALFFFTLGDFIKRKVPADSGSSPKSIAAIILFGALNIVFGVVLNVRISYTAGAFGNIYYCIIAAVAGTLFYYLLFKHWKLLGKIRVLNAMGRNSLIIMCTQYWFFRFFDHFSMKYYQCSAWHDRGTIKAFVIAIVTVCLIMLIVTAFKKVFRNRQKILNAAKFIGIQ